MVHKSRQSTPTVSSLNGLIGDVTLASPDNSISIVTSGQNINLEVNSSGFVTSVTGTTNRVTASPTVGNVVVDISPLYVGQSSITTLGTITTGIWNGSVITGQYGGTGIANTGLTINLAGGSVGKYFASDSSGNGAWATLSGSAVTSWQGTANQITPTTATTGVVTAALANGISLGSYQATTPPSGGIICPGNVAIGATSIPYTNMQFFVEGTGVTQTGVLANATSTIARTWFLNNSNSFGFGIDTDNNAALYNNINSITKIWNIVSGGGLAIGYGSTTAPSTGLIVNGQAGFGTSSPTNVVTVGTVNTSSGELIKINGTTAQSYMSVYDNATRQGYVGSNGSGSGFVINSDTAGGMTVQASGSNPIFFFTNGAQRATITSAGNFGIGNTPSTVLDVSGTVRSTVSSDGAATFIVLPNNGSSQAYGLTAVNAGGLFIGRTGATGGAVNSDIFITSTGNVSIGDSAGNSLFNVGTSNQFQISSTGLVRIGGAPVTTIQLYIDQDQTATSGSLAGIQIQSALGASSGTVAETDQIYIANNYNNNVGTISNAQGVNIAGGSATGTITTGIGLLVGALGYGTSRFGIYCNAPAGGTNKVTAYFDPGVGIGANATNQVFTLRVYAASNPNTYYCIYTDGTLVQNDTGASNGSQIGLGLNHVFNPTQGGTCFGTYITPTFIAPTGKTLANTFGIYINQFYNSNVGTITNAYGIQISAGSSGSGTVTNNYGLYVQAPLAGTFKIATYTDNIAVGVNAVPPTNGGIFNGNVRIGSNNGGGYLTVYCTPADQQSILYLNGTARWNSGTGGSFQTVEGLCASTGNTVTVGANVYVYPNFADNQGTITTAAGVYIDAAGGAGGIVTNSYGLYVKNPAYGTHAYTAYFDAGVYIGAVIAGNQANALTVAPASNANTYVASYIGGTLIQTSSGGTTGDQIGLAMFTTFNPTPGVTSVYNIIAQPTFIAPSTKTIQSAYGIYVNNVYSSNVGTISFGYGMLIDVGTSGAGTVSNAYGLYVTSPTAGTNNTTAYFAGNVGFNSAAGFAGGTNVIAIGNRSVAPSSTPSAGGVLYCESGSLKYKGSSGTVTVLALA